MTFTKTKPVLQLKELVFPVLVARATLLGPSKAPKPIELEDIEVSFEFDLEENDPSVGVSTLAVRSKDSADDERSLGYEFELQSFAVFEVDTNATLEPTLEYVRKHNAAVVLIGAVREQLAQLTARGPWGVRLLPNVPIQGLIGNYPVRNAPARNEEPKASEK